MSSQAPSAEHDDTSGRMARLMITVAERLSRMNLTTLTIVFWLANLLMCLILLGTPRDSIRGMMNITENWGAIERVALWQNFLDPVIPRFDLPRTFIVWSFRASMLTAFVMQVAAFAAIYTGKAKPSLWLWLLGPIGAHLIQFILMVPSNSDVFFYEAIGDLASRGINPFVHELMDFPDHPLIPYNFWIDIGTVYGPHWVNYNKIVMSVTPTDPIIATLVQKALAGVFAFALIGVIYWFTKHLSDGNQRLAVAAAVLVAWQPNMVLEATGQVHNDPHTVLLATLGLAVVILGGVAGVRAGVILVTLSTMVKFITLPLLGVIGIVRIVERKKPHAIKRIFGAWILDGIAIVAVVLGAFLPYWEGPETMEEMLHEPDRLYTHPIWRTLNGIIRGIFGSSVSWQWSQFTRGLLQIVTIVLFIGIVVWLGYKLWHGARTGNDADATSPGGLPWWTRPVLYAWMFMFFAVAYLPVNSHPWYWVWPVAAVAQVIAFDYRRVESTSLRLLPNWLWIYLWFNALMTLAYHTRVARY